MPSGVMGIETGAVTMNPEKRREGGYLMSYPTYEREYLESIKPKHKPPERVTAPIVLCCMWTLHQHAHSLSHSWSVACCDEL